MWGGGIRIGPGWGGKLGVKVSLGLEQEAPPPGVTFKSCPGWHWICVPLGRVAEGPPVPMRRSLAICCC